MAPELISGDCCRKTLLRYKLKSGSCVSVAGHSTNQCTTTVCNDGRHHPGLYCATGSCNVFGCNCDGGCYKGDAATNYQELNMDTVYDVFEAL